MRSELLSKVAIVGALFISAAGGAVSAGGSDIPVALSSTSVPSDFLTVGGASFDAPAGGKVTVPVFVRDVSGSSLGMDSGTGSRIQRVRVQVGVSPESAVRGVSVVSAGTTAGLTPSYEQVKTRPGHFSYEVHFDELTNPIPFNLDAPEPGDLIANLSLSLAPTLDPGDTIQLEVEMAGEKTWLGNQDGSAVETTENGGLRTAGAQIKITAESIPYVRWVLPNSGPTSGGQSVLISGENFENAVSVTFGGVNADIVSLSASRIEVSTPAHAIGPVDVVVTDSRGSRETLPDGYTYSEFPVADLIAYVWKVKRSGDMVKARITPINQGDGSAPAYGIDVYLSGDPTADPSDTYLGRFDVPELGPTERAQAIRVNGGYKNPKYLISVSDPEGAVPESKESNNIVVMRIR